MLKLKLLFSAFALFVFAGALSAQDLFTWSYVAQNGDSASGTLVATETTPTSFEWDVNSIQGTWSSPSGSITGLVPIGSHGNDNLFYYGYSGTTSSLGNGIGFTTSVNSNVVVFNNGDELIYGDSTTPISTSGYNTTAIPPNGYQFAEIGPAAAPWEPSDAVFLSGALAFGFMQYRRLRRRNASV